MTRCTPFIKMEDSTLSPRDILTIKPRLYIFMNQFNDRHFRG